MEIKKRGFSKRLKELREEACLTQRGLAQLIGVNVKTIKGWENGEHDISSRYILKLCRFFNVRCNYFLGVDDRRN